MARKNLRQVGLWGVSALLLLGAAGTAGYAKLSALYLGAALGAGGSEARGEAWRQAQGDPRALEELEARARSDRQWVEEQAAYHRRLKWGALGLAVSGIATGIVAWRGRNTARR
jgi:hypothetical protein